MSLKDVLEVDITEKDLIQIDIIEKELIKVNFNVVDVINATSTTTSQFIYNEIPTKINSKRFQIVNNLATGTLQVFLNGIKEKEITIINPNTFEFGIDTVIDDTIEVSYIKG